MEWLQQAYLEDEHGWGHETADHAISYTTAYALWAIANWHKYASRRFVQGHGEMKKAKRQRNFVLGLLLKAALPIDNIDRVLFDTNDGIVLVWVDIQERPDLAARHGEQEGDCICTLFSGNHNKRNMILGLRIEMRTPTRTAFHLAFKVERYIEQLSLLAQFGKIWIVPGPPPVHLTGTQAMSIQEFIEKVMHFLVLLGGI